MTTAIIDYGSGNLRSAEKAFQRMAEGPVVVTADPDQVRTAERIVLPGVGAYADCMAGLTAVSGMRQALAEKVIDGGAPFLGICVGMQMMATVGREHRDVDGFGWIPGEVVRLAPGDPVLKVPHMGWNELSLSDHSLLEGLTPGAHAYFVHSYHFRPRDPDHRIAHVAYGGMVVAAVAKDNMAGTQFHPEKSQATGLTLIANFLKWRP